MSWWGQESAPVYQLIICKLASWNPACCAASPGRGSGPWWTWIWARFHFVKQTGGLPEIAIPTPPGWGLGLSIPLSWLGNAQRTLPWHLPLSWPYSFLFSAKYANLDVSGLTLNILDKWCNLHRPPMLLGLKWWCQETRLSPMACIIWSVPSSSNVYWTAGG